MGERKVLNKYFPPDFDPSKVPRLRRPKGHQVEVRMMLPFTIQCTTCSEFMYRGKKFNSRKEDVEGDDYKGIRKFRFYIKCITCNREISFKTDPENADYELEVGATRNFESWKETEAMEKKAVEMRAAEDKGDPMKALENRTLDSKIEIDILDALDEIRAVNTRHERVDTAAIIQQRARKDQPDTTEIDNDLIKKIKFNAQNVLIRNISSESDSSEKDVKLKADVVKSDSVTALSLKKNEKIHEPNLVIIKKRRKCTEEEKKLKKKPKKVEATEGILGGLLGSYGSDNSG